LVRLWSVSANRRILASGIHARMLPRHAHAFVGWLICTVACTLAFSPLQAQSLRPKRNLTVSVAPGCEAVAPRSTTGRRDNAEARRLSSVGQDAALVGDQKAAREAFAKAAELNPSDDRTAYDLGRAEEALADSAAAVTEYCHYLTLSSAGREAPDVRARLQRLVPKGAAQRAQDLLSTFRLGLFLYDSGRYDAAERAFDNVVQKAPTASEGYFNRGLMRAAIGQREAALKDFESYLTAVPTADDRVEVSRNIAILRRPVYGAGTAFARGVIPGFGQFYTGRPVRGVLVLALVAGSAGASVVKKTTQQTVAYVDPNGVPAPYTQAFTQRPYLAAGVATAVGVTLLAAIEAAYFAQRSSRGASVLLTGQASTLGNFVREYGVSVAPVVDQRGRTWMQLHATF
jgi:tetratricopeptide (TPR) repeat protein